LWQSADEVQLFHVMANSGWSWHLFAAPAIWIARIKGKPVIVNYRGGEADAFFNKAFSWVKPSLNQADAIIVPSGFLDAVFRKYGFAPRIVPNIIDLSRFNADHNVGATLRSDFPCIIVARNLEPIYDNATALRAFCIIKDSLTAARLIIVGAGPERRALEKLAAELRLTDAVTFTGRVDNEAMARLYRSADLMINPSLADNMPISILEALASGVPVVSTDVGGIPYLVEHEKTAWLVPAKDPVAMANAILALLADPNKARKIKDAGIEWVRQYTWPNVRVRLLHVYEQVLTGTDKPAESK
jgi:glycosyltransferase involved in cell wall biosynthesis